MRSDGSSSPLGPGAPREVPLVEIEHPLAGPFLFRSGPAHGPLPNGRKLLPIDLKPGDRVLFGKWSGTEVKIDGEELLIMKESDVMGVLEGTKASRKVA